MATAPTGRQAEILAFIEDHVERHGYPPTVREIGRGVGLASPSTVHRHLEKLEEGGHLRRDPSKPRAMLVGLPGGRQAASAKQAASAAPAPMTLPLLGAVAAGAPILADEHVEDHVAAPFAADYLLRVQGDSMVNAGILDGDLVAVKQQDDVRDGQIVVALLEDEATVKRAYRESGGVRLEAENEAYDPIRSPDIRVIGRVVGVMRDL
ncbi:MAG: transcriptional repressor LexA [Actinobacteria bacterium]|nr:transcriptional repressor LexA [Actinomycetota bacterium]MBM3697240.1 transcriptional repressor LexA [Actinomycetota bacterium]